MAEPAVENQLDDTVTPMQTEPVSQLRAMSQLARASASNAGSAARKVPSRRGVQRYNSGGMPGGASSSRRGAGPSRRSAPRRTKSHQIGRPAFSADLASQDVPRTVNRTHSGMFTRAAPLRTGSFQRSVPNRSHSSTSLRTHRKQQQQMRAAAASGSVSDIPDDGDSVFTSASNQTLDSVMLRKRQIKSSDGGVVSGVPAVATLRRDRRLNAAHSTASSSFDIDESLHTVDSIPVHMRHLQQHHPNDEQCDLSVFSESFVSTETYMLSDYEEDEDEKFENLREDDENETFENLREDGEHDT